MGLFRTPHRAILSIAFLLLWALAAAGVWSRITGQFSVFYQSPDFGKPQFSIAFILGLIGLSLLIRLVESNWDRFRLGRSDVPFFVAASLALVTVLLFRALIRDDSRTISEAVQLQVQWVSRQVVDALDSQMRSSERMAARWSFRGGTDEKEWTADTLRSLKDFKGVVLYGWIDRKGIVRWVSPETQRTNLIGHSIENEPDRRKFFQEVKETGKLALTEIGQLRGGGLEFGAVIPVYGKNGQFDGALTTAYRVSEFIEKSFETRGYRVQFFNRLTGDLIYDNSLKVPGFVTPELQQWSESARLEYRNLKLDIRATPLPAVLQTWSTATPVMMLICGLCVSLLIASLIHLYLRATQQKIRAWEAVEMREALLDGCDLCVIATDSEGLVTFMSSPVEKLLGQSADEVRGLMTPAIWMEPKEIIARAEVLSHELGRNISPGFHVFTAKAELERVDRNEWTIVRKDAKRLAAIVSIYALHSENKKLTGYVWIIEDITERKQRDRQFSEQQAQMIQSSRLASLGEMAAGIAHEINNPLLVISGKVQKIRRLYELEKQTPERVLSQTDAIRHTVDRIAKIISGLQSFSRDSSRDPFVLESYRTIVSDTLSFCHERFRNESIELDVTLPNEDFVLECRPTQISQILLNLLNNGYDAAAENAKGVRKVHLSVVRTGMDSVEFSVTDTGRGIPEYLREKVMIPFFTTKEVGHGTGLGLSISQGIAQHHGGRLYFDETSSLTRFVLTLPLRQEIIRNV